MAMLSPLIAVALTVVDRLRHLRALRHRPARGLYVFFIEPLTAAWSLEDLVVKATPLVLIASGCRSATSPTPGTSAPRASSPSARSPARSIPILLPDFQNVADAAADDAHGRPRRHGLRGDPGAAEDPLRHQRDPDQPDAGLCRAALPRLAGARAVAQPEGVQLPRQPSPSPTRPAMPTFIGSGRLNASAIFALVVVLVLAVVFCAHADRVRDPRSRRGAARRGLCRLLAATA